MKDFLTRVLDYKQLSLEDYARLAREPSFDDLPTLDAFPSAISAKERLDKAAANHEKVLIYGDYDTDGIMATSIFVYALRKKGINPSFFIPSRYIDGYGITMDNARRIAQASFDLVILVDNGINAMEEVKYLRDSGLDVLIFDHHEVGETLPEANAIVHPGLLPLPGPTVSAGALSFLFSRFYLGQDDPYLATLGAMSIISDLMPMEGYNQKLVGLALRAIRGYKYKEIYYLTHKNIIDERVLGMEIIPCINAVGRMEKDHKLNRLVHYFADADAEKFKIASYMKTVNENRKGATKSAKARLKIDAEAPGILAIDTLPEGLNGLLANSLMFAYNKPTIVFSPSEVNPEIFVGSCRARSVFSFIDFLEYSKDFIVRGGGHEHAGGIGVSSDKIEEFRKVFYSYCSKHPFLEEKVELVDLELDDITMENYRILRNIGPYGQGNKEIPFVLKDFPLSSLRYAKDGKMISTYMKSRNLKLFSFSIGKAEVDAFAGKANLEGWIGLDENPLMHNVSVCFNIEKISS